MNGVYVTTKRTKITESTPCNHYTLNLNTPMPINSDTLVSIQTTEEVVKEFIPDPEKQYWFFRKLSKSLNFDCESRVTGFSTHLVNYRRKVVANMFHGNNIDEIAIRLQVSVKTIRNDLTWIEDNKHHPNSKKSK